MQYATLRGVPASTASPVRDYGIDTAKLESRRVAMRPLAGDALVEAVGLLADPARTLLFFQEPWSRARVAEWLTERSSWAFTYAGKLVAVGVGEMDAHRNLTVHAISGPWATGGLVLEAARLGIAVAFERLGARRLVATPIEGNVASMKLVRALGFKHEGTLRQAIHIAGRYRNIEMFALLKEV
jgi:RimJ/RimL family protein N-acetyltransferase